MHPWHQAQLKAPSGDWLQALPIAYVGILLSNDEINSVARRLGIRAYTPCTGRCGTVVDARSLHGLSCKWSTPHHQRHSMLNDIEWRAIKHAKSLTHNEPIWFILLNEKHLDGATLNPWSKGKTLEWIFTVPETYAATHLRSTVREAGSTEKHTVEMNLKSHTFFPTVIKTASTWDKQAMELVQETGRRCKLDS